MTADRGQDDEDAALAWAGDTDPSLIATPQRPESAQKPGKPEPQVTVELEPTAKPATPAMLLITYGVLGGVFLIYTIGWVIAVQRLNAVQAVSSNLLVQFMTQFGQALAIASPVIWVAAVFLLTRGSKPLTRLLWLLLGLLTVLPWPFALGAWLS